MVIYEVNLTLLKNIQAEFEAWLIPHVQQMLTFKGFQQAKILRELFDQEQNKLTVQYEVDTLDHLQDYFEHHAGAIRAEGVEKFGTQFSATRRVFNQEQVLKK